MNGEHLDDELAPPDGHVSHNRQTCPFLGLEDDPDTGLLFASVMGHCYRAYPHGPVKLEHQQAYCLTADHVNCRVFARQRHAPLPEDLLLPGFPVRQRHPVLRLLAQAFLLVVLIILGFGLFTVVIPVLQESAVPSTTPLLSTPPALTQTVQQVVNITNTPTHTALPTQTAVPTSTTAPTFTPTPLPTLPSTFTPRPTERVTRQPTATPTPLLVVSGESLVNVRLGPGIDYQVLGFASPANEYQIIGRLADNSWWQICCVQNRRGWISGENVEIVGVVDDIPVVSNLPPLPTATP